MSRHRIQLVDDDPAARAAVREYLEIQGYEVLEAETAGMAVEVFRTARPDVVVLDYRLPDGNALELLPRLKAIDSDVPILILTGHGTIDLAVTAIQQGADQFLTKPVQLPALHVLIQRAIDRHRRVRREVAGSNATRHPPIDPFAGESRIIESLRDQAGRMLTSDSPILILGETGVGKGVLARWLHESGPRRDEAFVDLNCAGLSREFLESELFGHERGSFTGAIAAKKGLLEVADRGSVFLDEIGDVDRDLQPKLLKVLEEKRFRRLGDVKDRSVDIRLIAATHQDLARAVQEGRFRDDLYYRINAIPLTVPALRDRQEDIPILARQFLDGFARESGRPAMELAPDAVDALRQYAWPGNIRELRNVLERAVLLAGEGQLARKDIPFNPLPEARVVLAEAGDLTLEAMEKRYVEQVLLEEGGRVESAARRLGIPRSSLYNKLKRWNHHLSRF
ncbi:MAG: sigma-54 dependent transcriptional regulator [Candidatus Eisenbacteria bacterium]|nr:sigma-54 dependent transcriptional regulator [Candidatus Eisenbacteria bacterium]